MARFLFWIISHSLHIQVEQQIKWVTDGLQQDKKAGDDNNELKPFFVAMFSEVKAYDL